MNDNSVSRILVVDDEELIREVMISSLQDDRYEIFSAASGEEALNIFQKHPCDVVLSDIMMSKISGIDLLFALKKINPDVEVILVTGFASVETAQAAVAGGAYRYIQKPFGSLQEISQIVEEALAAHKNKKNQKAQFQEALYQRDRLKKRLGQLETMYLISHAIGFPENIPLMLKDVAKLLGKVLPISMMACFIQEDHFIRAYIILLSPISQNEIEKFAHDWQKGMQEGIQQKLIVDKSLIENSHLPEGKIDKLIEIPFPGYSNLRGSLCVVLPKMRNLQSDEEELLDVTAAQIAGTIQRLQEFHKKERDRMNLFINGMNDGVIVLNEMGTVSMANDSAFALLKCSQIKEIPEALKNMGLEKILQQTQGNNVMLGDKIKISDGRIFSISALPLSYPWELMSGIIFRDMTKQYFLQKELERSSRLSAVGELLSGVVHEINTPLTVILGYASLLVNQDVPPDVKHDLNLIQSEAARCQKLMQNLLNLARHKVLKKIHIEAKELIEKALELKQFAFRKYNIEVVRDYPQEHILIEVEPGQIQQVLLNLMNNAQDAMESLKQKILKISLRKNQTTAFIQVKDNGHGIPDEFLEKIFDPFFTTKEIGKGSGLGLSISHNIIQEHHGKIKAINEESGALFTIELPLYNENKSSCKAIFIGSDQEVERDLSRHLSMRHIDFKALAKEDVAIHTLQTEKYEIVFLDMIPSNMEKREILFKILETKYFKRCIVLADGTLDAIQYLIEEKHFLSLEKPISLRELEALLKPILEEIDKK
ncbi:MAG: response regulator [Candidatus Brocadiae bacterium]|nr:response regulator [Candidatus Brocadiia bacterium]